MIDSRALRVGNALEIKHGITQWHCLICYKRLRNLSLRNHHEWEEHPVKMWIIYIQELNEDYDRMDALIEEYLELEETQHLDQPKLPDSVNKLIKARMKDIKSTYKYGMWNGDHPLVSIEKRKNAAKDKLTEAMQRDDSEVVV